MRSSARLAEVDGRRAQVGVVRPSRDVRYSTSPGSITSSGTSIVVSSSIVADSAAVCTIAPELVPGRWAHTVMSNGASGAAPKARMSIEVTVDPATIGRLCRMLPLDPSDRKHADAARGSRTPSDGVNAPAARPIDASGGSFASISAWV